MAKPSQQKTAGAQNPAPAALSAAIAAAAPSSLAPHNYGELSGKGSENLTSADMAIPFLQVLQAMSPECTRGKPEFLPDARPGMLLDTVSKQLFDGEAGLLIVPVTTAHTYIEWVPRDKGGGIRGVHMPESDFVKKAKEAAGVNIGKIPVAPKAPNEPPTELIETFQIFAMLLDDVNATEVSGKYVIPFTSTKIKRYKNAMTVLHTVKGNPPLFAHRVRLVVVPDQNNKGSFFNVELRPALGDVKSSLIPPSYQAEPGAGEELHPILKAGKLFLDQIRGGAAKVAYDSATDGGGEGGDTRDPKSPF